MDHHRTSLFLALSLLALSAGAAEPRLFFTPSERAALDAARIRNFKPRVVVNATPAEIPSDIAFSGYVRRSDGRATVWVNGEAVPAGDANRRYGVAAELDHGRLRSRAGPVKPGQILPGGSRRPVEGWAAPAAPPVGREE